MPQLLAVKPVRTLPRTRLTHWALTTEAGEMPKLCLCKRARAGEIVQDAPGFAAGASATVTCHRCGVVRRKQQL